MPLDMTDIQRELEKDPPTKYPPILGLVGPLGSGKTTLADAVAAEVKGRRLSCADPIRKMLHALGVPREDLTTHKNKPQPWLHGHSSRSMLKSLGTEWGRTLVGPDIWINAVLRVAQHPDNLGVPIVVDDIRFDNEAHAIKWAGGHLFFVYHPGIGYSYAHPSECGLSDWSLLDGVVNLETREVFHYPEALSLSHGCGDILRRRPWWSRFAWGRRLFGSKRPPIISPYLRPARETAQMVAACWPRK